MIDSELLEKVTIGIAALGTIFYSVDEIHEVFYVKTIEVGFSMILEPTEVFQGPTQREILSVRGRTTQRDHRMHFRQNGLRKIISQKNCCCLSQKTRCQTMWVDSWLEGLPLRYGLRDLKEQVEIILRMLDMNCELITSRIFNNI